MFNYQPTFNTLELKKRRSTYFVFIWKSKEVCNSKLKPLYTAFLHSLKYFGYRTGIKFDKDLLAIEQNNCFTKILNIYMVYGLDIWSRNTTNNFKIKNCLFGATNIVKYSDKEKYVHSGYRITFDGANSWSFDNGFARNVII